MDFKQRFNHPVVKLRVSKYEAFNKVYIENMRTVIKKSAVRKLEVSRALFDIWRDSLAPEGWKDESQLLEIYTEYLIDQGLIPKD